jgi:SlyX protein
VPAADQNLEFQFDRRFTELETRLAFQEQALTEMSDALAASRAENAQMLELLRRVTADLRQLRGSLDPDPAGDPPPPHY